MKIGLLTVPFNNNYGGFLQAYALSNVLKNMGHEVVIINRRRNRSPQKIIKQMLSFLIPDKKEKIIREISIHTDKFVSENFIITKPIFSKRNLRKECYKNEFDCLIVGSDQVWRYKYAGNSIEDYFFGFLDNSDDTPRFSYAASIGVDYNEYPQDVIQECVKYLQRFKSVSVREASAINLLSTYFNFPSEKITVVADPTLLLTPVEYNVLTKKYDEEIKGEYLFYYILDEYEETKSLKAVVSKYKFPCITFKVQPEEITRISVIKPVEKWLAYIAKAKFVITDSYHGAVFSILFNRPFAVIVNKTRGYTRVEQLLSHYGLMQRLVKIEDKADFDCLVNEGINWEAVNEQINKDRVTSINFITTNLL